jgi:lysine-specific demethylase 8
MINNLENIHVNSSYLDKINFNIKDRPYLIKNFSKDWPAQNKWNFDFIKNLDENAVVNTVVGNAAGGKKDIKKTLLKNYIEKINSDELDAYLTTFHLFKKFPFLKKDIDIRSIEEKSFFQHLLAWIGPKETITGFHVDWSENINVQISGKKDFFLVNPKYNKYMYESNTFERISKTSKIDLNNLDSQNFPLFKNAQVEKFTLEQSDAIYIPRGWWHFVKSQMPSISVSIHYWSLKNSIRDLPIELTKVFLHDIGIYKKNNCACHQIVDGIRIKRG